MIDGEYQEGDEKDQLLFAAMRALQFALTFREGTYYYQEAEATYKRLCDYFERKKND